MALYRLEAKIISRQKQNRSVVAAAAYRGGLKLVGEREGKTHDYTRRSKGVMTSMVLCPEGAPQWAHDPALLWNAVERSEKRVDAQLAREFVLAVPTELTTEQQIDLAAGWAKDELVSKGMVAHLALHHPKSGTNPHVHLLCTLRRFDGDAFASKKAREWNDVAFLVSLRESWAKAQNSALEKAGSPERVDHRSLKDRGIDQIPQPKIGVAATAMEKRGAVKDPERKKEVRFIRLVNEAMPFIRAIQRTGGVKPERQDTTWLQKSTAFVARTKTAVRSAVLDAWNGLRGSSKAEAKPARESVLEVWGKLRTRMAFETASGRNPEPQAPMREPELTR